MSKLYTLIEKNKNGLNIHHLTKGSCKEAVEILQEEVDPTLQRFEGEEYKYQSNSPKFINILVDMLKAEQNRTIAVVDNYRMKGGRIV